MKPKTLNKAKHLLKHISGWDNIIWHSWTQWAWELPYAAGTALKRQKKKKKNPWPNVSNFGIYHELIGSIRRV